MNTPRSHRETGTESLLFGLRGWTRRAVKGVLGAGALSLLAGCGAVQAGGYSWDYVENGTASGKCSNGMKIFFSKTDGWWYPAGNYVGGYTPDEAANKICPEKKVASAGSGGEEPAIDPKEVAKCERIAQKNPARGFVCHVNSGHVEYMFKHASAVKDNPEYAFRGLRAAARRCSPSMVSSLAMFARTNNMASDFIDSKDNWELFEWSANKCNNPLINMAVAALKINVR